ARGAAADRHADEHDGHERHDHHEEQADPVAGVAAQVGGHQREHGPGAADGEAHSSSPFLKPATASPPAASAMAHRTAMGSATAPTEPAAPAPASSVSAVEVQPFGVSRATARSGSGRL